MPLKGIPSFSEPFPGSKWQAMQGPGGTSSPGSPRTPGTSVDGSNEPGVLQSVQQHVQQQRQEMWEPPPEAARQVGWATIWSDVQQLMGESVDEVKRRLAGTLEGCLTAGRSCQPPCEVRIESKRCACEWRATAVTSNK